MQTISIEDQVIKTYQSNINYLQNSHPKLFQKIVEFESALENGHYQSRYELEYKDEGYFDVRELSSGKYLYGEDSKKYAKDIAKSIDYRKEDNLFILSPRFTFSKESLEIINKTDINSNNAYGVASIIDYINRHIPKNSTMKKIDKFIFFGVGLGLHVESVHEKINSDYYLLVEDDLELFRLSLFTTDYEKLSKHSELSFCIFEDDVDAKKIMSEFLENAFMHNHYLKFIHSLHHSDSKMRVMHEIISAQPHQIFPYHAYFNKFLRPLEYLKDGYNFLNIKSANDILSSKPVLLLAAGPSLQEHIEWVKKNQDRFTIIALTSTLKTLENADIKPDIITHLDPFADGSLPHVENLKNRSYFDESICLFAGQSPKEVTKMFKKENIFFYENGTFYKKGYGSLGAPCIGSMSYVLSLVLGVKDLYLLGLDLALSKDGETHANSHAHTQSLDTSDIDKMQEVFELKKSVIKIKGNFKDEVLTTANFYISIDNIKQNTLLNKTKNQKVYNLSDGAYLEDTLPLSVDNLDIENFKLDSSDEKFKLLRDSFISNSTNTLSKTELIAIKKMLDHALKVKKILKQHKSIKYQNSDNYKYALLGLSLDLTSDSTKEAEQLNLVNLYYMQYIYPYIFDLLNTRELKDEQTHIKKVDSMLVSKMLEIVKEFEDRLKLFFKKENL
jgi:hypothetical protein